MNDLSPLSDLVADDLFLDRLAGRTDSSSEPLAGLLGALATHADTPLPSRTGRRRIANKHRYLGAFAALALAASGAGVAAAVSLPDAGPSQADRARIVQKMDESARSGAPSALLSRLGLPQTNGTTTARGLVLARRDDGTIVLLPAAVAAAELARRGGASATGGSEAAGGQAGGAPNGGQTGGNVPGGSTGGGTVGDTPAGDEPNAGEETPPQAGGSPTGTPQTTTNGKKDDKGTKSTKDTAIKPTPTTVPTPTTAPTPTTLSTDTLSTDTPSTETPVAPSTTSGSTRPTSPSTPPVKGRSAAVADGSETATTTP